MTANSTNLQGQLNVVWDKLLSAFSDKPIAENPSAVAELRAITTGLKAKR
jgi:hypothetical protein